MTLKEDPKGCPGPVSREAPEFVVRHVGEIGPHDYIMSGTSPLVPRLSTASQNTRFGGDINRGRPDSCWRR